MTRTKATSSTATTCRRLVYDHIVRGLVAGEFAAGSALREIPLAKKIGVSRTPVREAIGQLVAEGMLHETPGGVMFVEPSRRDIIELYELREALEVFAVAKAARLGIGRAEAQALDGLVDEVHQCRALLSDSGAPVLSGSLLQRFLSADFRFHVLLLQSAGNERISRAAADARLLIRIFTLQRAHHTAELLEQIESYHRETLRAVQAGDAEKASKVLAEHIHLSLEERLAEYQGPQQISHHQNLFSPQ
jgi:DNA-binding GntR family transcriptional regulator